MPLTHKAIIKNFGHGSVDKVCAMGGGVIGGYDTNDSPFGGSVKQTTRFLLGEGTKQK